MKKVLYLAFPLFLLAAGMNGQEHAAVSPTQTGIYLDTFWAESGDTLLYRMMLPHGFDVSREYPVVLFLHGMGERGSDNKKQLIHGSKLFSDSIGRYPAIVIFPQCPETDYWANLDRSQFDANGMRLFRFRTEDRNPHPGLGKVMRLVRHYASSPFTDDSRFYLVGLSMGAMGTFDLLWRMPDTFAAAAPICGSGPLDKVDLFSELPLWIFHGAKDRTVDPENSLLMVSALREAGAHVRFTMYPDASHNSWDPAFAEPDFLKWLFSHSRE